ncbi:MAG: hypothetical protein A2X12_03185 [Bacteroidetes bacterium GWE2_29_8]|nr:MAG: hypothetical protein A2X12_03185 [Bacteroidetes bacterium GWE2_29_8]OFY22390.1 MAG: hypothetical protein A2X02_01950 [Bacteroidetes bacterium GWF2_29_10]
MQYDLTNNNLLINKANYNYYPYKGAKFIDSYFLQRNSFLCKIELYDNCKNKVVNNFANNNFNNNTYFYSINNITAIKLSGLLISFINNKDSIDFELILKLLKSFSVNQKLYNFYTENFVPIKKSLYTTTPNYILFAKLCIILYKETKHLTYLNSLIKTNDIITSFQTPCILNNLTKEIIETEIIFVKSIIL